jgi:hypothetical protein
LLEIDLLNNFFKRDDDFDLYRNKTKTLISFYDKLICITLTKRSLNVDDLSTRFWLQFFLSIIDNKMKKRFVILLKFKLINIDFFYSFINVICSMICEIFVNNIIVVNLFIRFFAFYIAFMFRDVSTCKIDLFFYMIFNLRFFIVFTSH